MIDFLTQSAYFGVLLTIGAYAIGHAVRNRTGKDIANPLLIAMLIVMAVLLAFDIDYSVYEKGAQTVSWLLTPATVCLALPLYRTIDLVRKNVGAIAVGILSGVLSSAVLITLIVVIFRLDAVQYATLLPKSVTTAVGMGISEELGGIPALTVASIVITGLCGNLTARFVCRVCRVTDPVAIGLAIGASCHALGTAKALEMGEVEGAMSSIAVAVCGLVTVGVAPIMLHLLA